MVQTLPLSSLYFILLVPTEQTGFNTRKTDAYPPRGVLPGILSGVVPSGTPNPDPISHLFSASKKLCLHYIY